MLEGIFDIKKWVRWLAVVGCKFMNTRNGVRGPQAGYWVELISWLKIAVARWILPKSLVSHRISPTTWGPSKSTVASIHTILNIRLLRVGQIVWQDNFHFPAHRIQQRPLGWRVMMYCRSLQDKATGMACNNRIQADARFRALHWNQEYSEMTSK